MTEELPVNADPKYVVLSEEHVRRNAQRACKKCPGFCCLTFCLPFSYDAIPAKRDNLKAWVSYLEYQISVLETVNAFYHGGRRPYPAQLAERIADYKEGIRDLDIWEHILIPVRMSASFMRSHPEAGVSEWYFTCHAYNHVSRRCTRYNDRPNACPKFVCTEGMQGHPPTGDYVFAIHAKNGNVRSRLQEARSTLTVLKTLPKSKNQ